MRAAVAILIAFLAGFFIAGIDLLSALLQYNRELAKLLYYVSLDGIVLLLAFLLVAVVCQKVWYLTFLLFVSVFFAIEAWWNMVYAIIGTATGTIVYPLDLGLGQFASESQYFIGILVQLTISFAFYLTYCLEIPQ